MSIVQLPGRGEKSRYSSRFSKSLILEFVFLETREDNSLQGRFQLNRGSQNEDLDETPRYTLDGCFLRLALDDVKASPFFFRIRNIVESLAFDLI